MVPIGVSRPDEENQDDGDSMRMALAAPGCKCGQGGGPLSYQLVPAAAAGPRHPTGAERARERSTSRIGLDGERDRGSHPHWRAIPTRRRKPQPD